MKKKQCCLGCYDYLILFNYIKTKLPSHYPKASVFRVYLAIICFGIFGALPNSLFNYCLILLIYLNV